MKRVSGVLVFMVVVTAALVAAVVASGGVASPSGPAAATKVAVKATEFRFALSKRTVRAGKVTFVVTNKGKVPHDFKIRGKKTPTLKPGKSATLRMTLRKGKSPYLCTLPGHAAAGMKGALVVKG